ncbi:uncharacterized protein LOC130813079 [Amaranthus tricolor]|uniref:uncharacterized protein LOC130813079 n=1 Tax=Amaranthus tricolor TaxID=29722 RepID=UPI00258DD812|nr:uncharacterized protein LOC130813079 [Amaranthus tricolor]XP_057534780.1 uncharacterized protein LOC130813079 [Amaranthus tricolor]
MAVPEVDKNLLEKLEEMGFSLACSTRALHYSGNTNLEDAINWIIEHENDSDIDQMPLVPVDIDLDDSKPFPISEEVKIKAEKLRNGARQFYKDKDKDLEREREKERIQAKKIIMEAKRIAEENARKRMIASIEAEKEEERRARERIWQKLEAEKEEERRARERIWEADKEEERRARERIQQKLEADKEEERRARERIRQKLEADKEEERRARERIRQKLEADKAERRSKLGIQPVLSSPPVQPAIHAIQKNAVEAPKPVKSTKKAEVLNNCLRSLKRYNKDKEAKVNKAFQTLQIYIRNVMNNPDVEKFRNIRLANPVFQERVGSLTGGVRFLELCGFQKTKDGRFLYLPRDRVDMNSLNAAMSALHSAITNPFYGLFSTSIEKP